VNTAKFSMLWRKRFGEIPQRLVASFSQGLNDGYWPYPAVGFSDAFVRYEGNNPDFVTYIKSVG